MSNNPFIKEGKEKKENDLNPLEQMTSENKPLMYPKTVSKKFEDTHKRATFYIKHDTLDKLDMAAGTEKGVKTDIVNKAIEEYLEKYYAK